MPINVKANMVIIISAILHKAVELKVAANVVDNDITFIDLNSIIPAVPGSFAPAFLL